MRGIIYYGPPGTAKTTTLLEHLKERREETFMYLAYTRTAANEAAERFGGSSDGIRTIHSLCYEILGLGSEQVVSFNDLRRFGKLIGYPVTGEADGEEGDKYFTLLNYSRNARVSLRSAYEKLRLQGCDFKILEFFSDSYRKWKNKLGLVDYTDMLEKVAGEEFEMAVKTLLIDEAQDLSPLQWEVVDKIKAEKSYLCGDDDQAMYVWNGADPHAMTDYAERNNLVSETLKQSYRVPRKVHALAGRILRNIRKRIRKEYHPTELEGTVERKAPGATSFDESLVLYRTKYLGREIEEVLVERGVPYKIYGQGKGMFYGREANAARTYMALQRGDSPVHPAKIRSLLSFLPAQYTLGRGVHLKRIRAAPWGKILKLEPAVLSYLSKVDLDIKPNITLSTIHSAKGREADKVIVHTGMGRTAWEALSRTPDDEHRVWYVAVTRARKNLAIVPGTLDYIL